MKVSIAQLDIERGDPETNLDRIEKSAAEAAAQGAELLCLPEMATTGFDWERNRELLKACGQHHQQLSEIARTHRIALCGSYLEEAPSGKAANTLIYHDATGLERARYRKMHLFTLFREHEHVEAGDSIVTADLGAFKAGFAICYDLRFPELFRRNMEAGAALQILPAAFPHPRLEHWRTLLRARAIENQCFFIGVNQCGFERHGASVGQTRYFGHSMVIDPWGEILAEAGEEAVVLTFDLDLDLVERVRKKMPSLVDRRPDLYGKRACGQAD